MASRTRPLQALDTGLRKAKLKSRVLAGLAEPATFHGFRNS
jgi:hypothetical protein